MCGGGGGGGFPNIISSTTFQSGDEARVRYSPIILYTELLLTFYTLSIIAEVTRLNLQKKKKMESFCAISVPVQGRGTCACTY